MIAALAFAFTTIAASPVVHRHVVVVGVNTSVDPKIAPLSYADDDAARYAETFAGSSSLRVLSVLDADTQRMFPDVAATAHAPTSSEFHAAIDGAFADIARDREGGNDADFVLVLVGHGGVDDGGEGFVSLLDAKLTRTSLIEDVIAKSPARFNHVVIDACNAYNVLYRGGDAAVNAVRGFVEERSLSHYPNTGVLLATSSARDTHEWTRIRGGVFSHEVLAALSGAADVDGDGALSYPEIGAFIEAANAGVKDARAHVDFTLRAPPLFLARPLSSTPASAEHTLVIAAKDAGHFVVEDARGVAVVEVNKSAEQPLSLSLSGAAPFRIVKDAVAWIDDVAGRVSLATLKKVDDGDQVASRSAVSDSLEAGLFTVPFGKSYVAGYAARMSREPVAASTPAPAPFPVAGVIVTTAGGALLIGAGVAAAFGVGGVVELNDGRGKISAFDAADIANRSNAAFIASGALALGAVAAGVVGGVMLASSM